MVLLVTVVLLRAKVVCLLIAGTVALWVRLDIDYTRST